MLFGIMIYDKISRFYEIHLLNIEIQGILIIFYFAKK